MEMSFFDRVSHVDNIQIVVTPISLQEPTQNEWYYFGNAQAFNDVQNRQKLPPLSDSDKKILWGLLNKSTFLPSKQLDNSRGILKDMTIIQNVGQIAVYLFGSPLTDQKFQSVGIVWIPNHDFWDDFRANLSKIGAAATPVLGAIVPEFTPLFVAGLKIAGSVDSTNNSDLLTALKQGLAQTKNQLLQTQQSTTVSNQSNKMTWLQQLIYKFKTLPKFP